MKSLLVFPIEKERRYFAGFLQRQKISLEYFSMARSGNLIYAPSINAYLAVGGHGKVQFGLQSQYLLDRLEGIAFLFCIGSAGSLDSSVKIGDTVIGTGTVEHDYREAFSVNSPLPFFKRSIEPKRKISFENEYTFDVHEGIIASGDEDIVSEERSRELYARTEAIAVAWEGAGGARAAHFNGLGFAEIRGITDNACHDVPASFIRNLPVAMENTARVFVDLFA